jgi:valacyclovir hydrolase
MWFEHDGNRIYYEEEGSGDPVLLLPGFSVSIEDLQGVRQALVRQFRVIAADLPGSGRSGPQPRTYPSTYYQDDEQSFLALLEETAAGPAHVVGFSDGGEHALVMAELRPAAVRSVVTWGAGGTLATPPEMVAAMAEIIDNPLPPLKAYSDFLRTTYGEENARAMTRNAARAWGAIQAAGGDISRKRAGEIACPSLLITGEHDVLASPATAAEMAGAIPGGEFIEVKGASHGVHHEQPEWLATTIVDWLALH